MKRSLSALLALLLVLTLCACGAAEEAADQAQEETAQTQEEGTETQEEGTEAQEETGNGSKLAAVFDAMDPETGVHLNYDVYVDALGTNARYDVQGKGSSCYTLQSLLREGAEDYDSIKLVLDGTYYTLQVRDKTGMSSQGMAMDNALLSDTLYAAVMRCKDRGDFTESEAVLGETTYQAEVFPVTPSSPLEQTFCFDDEGNLAGYIISANEEMGVGEMVYTVNTIDDQVDESLFTVDGYTITEI